MRRVSFTKLGIAVAGVGLAISAGSGIASADPIADSTCSYSQFVSALGAQDPVALALFNASPPTQASLQQFLAAPKSQRVVMAKAMRSDPGNQAFIPVVERTFSVCNNY